MVVVDRDRSRGLASQVGARNAIAAALRQPRVGRQPVGGGSADDRLAPGSCDEARPQITGWLRTLSSLGQYFGRPFGEAALHAAVAAVPEGGPDARFAAACLRLGLRATRIPLTKALLQETPSPIVLLAHDGQSVALYLDAASDGTANVLDPVTGRTACLGVPALMARAAHALAVAPIAAVPQSASRRALFPGPIASALAQLLAASCVINILALATPLYMMLVVDQIAGRVPVGQLGLSLIALTVAVGVAYLFDLGARFLRGLVAGHAGTRLETDLSNQAMRHVLRLPYGQLAATPSGAIAERVRQLDTVRHFFTGSVPALMVDLGFAGIYLGIVLFISWPVGLAAVAALPLFAAISMLARRSHSGRLDADLRTRAARHSMMAEIIGNALTVKALGLEREMARRWRTCATTAASSGQQVHRLTSVAGALAGALQQFMALGVIVFGVHQMAADRLSLGGLMAIVMLAGRALSPMRHAIDVWHAIQSVRAAVARVEDLAPLSPETAACGEATVADGAGELALDGVSFRYADGPAPVLHEVDLRLAPGTVIGIVGPSGSGKTTIGNLLQGLYAPTAGRVLLDGTDIAQLSPTLVRRQIASVPQDIQLFAGTVRDNIALGVPDMDPAQVVAVAKFVGAHRFIQRLPRGYDTVLGERGSGLSAGQRQLLCIARALIRNPRVLVLDEATSALDPASEEHLLRALRSNARGRTIVVISHRLAPLAIADTVALVIDGRVERCGPPTEVMAYARIRMTEVSRGATLGTAEPARDSDGA